MNATIRVAVTAVMLILVRVQPALGHPGHDHFPSSHRVWRDVAGRDLYEASFVVAREGKVLLGKPDGTLAWISLVDLNREDQDWIANRVATVFRINHGTGLPHYEPSPSTVWKGHLILALGGPFVLIAIVGIRRNSPRFAAASAAIVAAPLCFVMACSDRHDPDREEPVTTEEGPIPTIVADFQAFKDKLKFRWSADRLFVESNGLPDHPMMVGIVSWQQQVPLPQPYTGRNAWQIPLKPKLAEKPISGKTAFYRGAIALAVNGVPIFNALNNRGDDAFLAGELDEFGGHCGKGDDYHYHIAPLHLQKWVGEGKPIAYALDGFPLYGLTEEKLDEFNGRFDKDGRYRYHATKTYPYINGGMRGVVEVRGDQVDPQPHAGPIRPPGTPLRDAKIVGFVADRDQKNFSLQYDVKGERRRIDYKVNPSGSFTFSFVDGRGNEQTQTYERKEGKKADKKGEEKKKK